MAFEPAPIVESITAGEPKNRVSTSAWVTWLQKLVAFTNLLRTDLDALANTKIKMTAEGGIAVKYTNKTGAASVKGELVTPYDATAINQAVKKVIQNVPATIGVFYESGVADGAEAWVVVLGIADVYFVGNAVRGHLARSFVTADGDYVIGQAKSEAFPAPPFANDRHFAEIGHVLESRTGSGLAKVNLHFN